tara:strand:+ start:8118 stop:11543 length:3426 start_codon:yes stop_codon:yes gene_type:complete
MSMESPSQQEIVEQLIADCLERLPEEGEAVVAAVCREYPAYAATVRELLGSLGRVGLIEPDGATSTASRDMVGPYRLLERIGKGGMGEVYLAEQQSPQRRVALKLLRSGHLLFTRSRERFRREIDAIAQLDHPGICPLFDAGETDGVPFLAMRYVEGETLAQHIATRRSNSLSQASTGVARAIDSTGREAVLEIVLLVEKLARALHHAHEKGLVHRDVKPGNVMITPEGEPVLLDFGLALTNVGDHSSLTLSGDLVGTPSYMSPEQVMGDRDIDRRTDVYSLGATLYEALTLRCPHEAPTRDALYRLILGRSEIRPASTQNRAIPRDLEIVIETALDRDANRRYATALAFANDLRCVREHRPIAAQPIGAWLRLRRWAQRRPAAATALAATLTLLVAGLAFTLVALAALARENRTARALGLAGAAADQVRSNPTRAMLLALHAIELEDRIETRSALHRALTANHERRVFTPADRLTGADALPDGSRFVTGSLGNKIQLWSRNGEQLWERALTAVPVPRRGIAVLQFAGTDRILAGNRKGEVCLFDLDGVKLDRYDSQRWLRSPPIGPMARQESPIVLRHNGAVVLLAVAGDQRNRLEVVQELAQEGPARTVVFHPDGSWLATAAQVKMRGHLWQRMPSGKYRDAGPLLPKPAAITSFAFSDMRLVVGIRDAANVSIDLETGTRTTFGSGTAVSVLEGGRGFIETTVGGGFTLTNASQQATTEERERRSGHVLGPATTSATGERFAASYIDGSIGVFDHRGHAEATLLGHVTQPRQVRFIRDGQELFSFASGRSARLWTVDDPLLARRVADRVWLSSIRPDGTRLVSESDKLVMYDSRWSQRRQLTEAGTFFATPAFGWSTDGRRIAVVEGAELRVIDVDTGEVVFRHRDEVQQHGAYCWLPRSNQIMRFSGLSYPFGASVIDIETGAETALRVGQGEIWSVTPLPDGTGVLIARSGGQVQLFERVGSSWQRQASVQTGGTRAVAITPDGQTILLGTDDGLVLPYRINPPGNGNRLAPSGEPFLGHRLLVVSVCCSPDGQLVATTSLDGTARLWRLDGTPLAVLEGPPCRVNGAAFTPDGRQLLTGHADGTVRTWFVQTEYLVAAAKQRCSRNSFTADELRTYQPLLGTGSQQPAGGSRESR